MNKSQAKQNHIKIYHKQITGKQWLREKYQNLPEKLVIHPFISLVKCWQAGDYNSLSARKVRGWRHRTETPLLKKAEVRVKERERERSTASSVDFVLLGVLCVCVCFVVFWVFFRDRESGERGRWGEGRGERETKRES